MILNVEDHNRDDTFRVHCSLFIVFCSLFNMSSTLSCKKKQAVRRALGSCRPELPSTSRGRNRDIPSTGDPSRVRRIEVVEAKMERRAVACALVAHDWKTVLIQREAKEAGQPWGLPGGKPERGETMRGAAVREMREEVGVVVEYYSLKEVAQFECNGWDMTLFLTQRWTGTPTACESQPELRWSTIDELTEHPPGHRASMRQCKGALNKYVAALYAEALRESLQMRCMDGEISD